MSDKRKTPIRIKAQGIYDNIGCRLFLQGLVSWTVPHIIGQVFEYQKFTPVPGEACNQSEFRTAVNHLTPNRPSL